MLIDRRNIHLEHGNLRWLSGVSFLDTSVHFLKVRNIFCSTYGMIMIQGALASPDPGACFKYPQYIHITYRKFSRAL